MSTRKPEKPSGETIRETMHEIVKHAIMMHSSPAVANGSSHGAPGQAAYMVVDNHVRFVAMEIAEKLGEARIELTVCRGCDLSGEFHVLTEGRGGELCDGGEPVTADLLRDLASRIPNTTAPRPARTRSWSLPRSSNCRSTRSTATPAGSSASM